MVILYLYFCGNDDGSVITVANGGRDLALAQIYRNGEIKWNRRVLLYDEFDPPSTYKSIDINNVMFDGYSNVFTGYYRDMDLFKGNVFCYFGITGGIVQRFSYDTTYKSFRTGFNITSFFDILYTHPTFVTNRYELFTNDSVDYYYKYYMMRYDFSGKIENSVLIDTINAKVLPSGMNLHFRYNTILNLNFYNESALGIPKMKLKINYLNDNIKLLKTIIIPFDEFPDDFTFNSITYIQSPDTAVLRFYTTSQSPNKLMMFLEINPLTKSIKWKSFEYYKTFRLVKCLYDKDKNIILAGMCDRNPAWENGPRQFAIFKFDTLFNLKDSLIWERGENSFMQGFDKFGEDEFIITGYYIDKDNYNYGYTARLNSNPSGINEITEDGISFRQYDEQLSIESNSQGLDIQIFDVLGKVCFAKKCDEQSTFIDLASIPKGLFIVSVRSGTPAKVFKLMN